jgi:putative transposase
VPVGLAVEGANRPDFKMARETVESAPVSRPEARPAGRRRQHICLDKGYDYAEVDELVSEFGFTAHVARRGEAPKQVERGARKRARRWVVERSHSWMNRFRAILIRWNKKAANYIGMLHFALGIIAYRASGLFG